MMFGPATARVCVGDDTYPIVRPHRVGGNGVFQFLRALLPINGYGVRIGEVVGFVALKSKRTFDSSATRIRKIGDALHAPPETATGATGRIIGSDRVGRGRQ